jgi:inhibitor of KinA sporulation pathway (predicted exonuclease)
MTKPADTVLVVDIEATCWEGAIPPGEEPEIIEIGLCVLDVASGERREKTSLLVRPERSAVSPFCTQLTTLTQADVDAGRSFRDACALLKSRYTAKDRIWASYGEYDRQQFERQCHSRGVPYPFGARHLNVKTLFALVHALPAEVGMAAALARQGLPLEGTHHRGADDAWNIAHLLAVLLGPRRAG